MKIRISPIRLYPYKARPTHPIPRLEAKRRNTAWQIATDTQRQGDGAHPMKTTVVGRHKRAICNAAIRFAKRNAAMYPPVWGPWRWGWGQLRARVAVCRRILSRGRILCVEIFRLSQDAASRDGSEITRGVASSSRG